MNFKMHEKKSRCRLAYTVFYQLHKRQGEEYTIYSVYIDTHTHTHFLEVYSKPGRLYPNNWLSLRRRIGWLGERLFLVSSLRIEC